GRKCWGAVLLLRAAIPVGFRLGSLRRPFRIPRARRSLRNRLRPAAGANRALSGGIDARLLARNVALLQNWIIHVRGSIFIREMNYGSLVRKEAPLARDSKLLWPFRDPVMCYLTF